MWEISVDGSQITVNTGKEEISAVPGPVTFRPGEVGGERCVNESPVSLSDLGVRGEKIITMIRTTAPEARVMISTHNLRISGVSDPNASALEAGLRLIESAVVAEPAATGQAAVSWLSNSMVRIAAPHGTELSTAHRIIHFDEDKRHLVFYDLGDKSLVHELTEHGQRILDKLIELAKQIPLSVVGISRDFVELCLKDPIKDKKQVQHALSSFSFAVA